MGIIVCENCNLLVNEKLLDLLTFKLTKYTSFSIELVVAYYEVKKLIIFHKYYITYPI